MSKKKNRVAESKKAFDGAKFISRAKEFRKDEQTKRLQKALEDKFAINIIAEIKRASPSKGLIKENADVGKIAENYQNFGAKAISVLTEEDFFKGSIEDLSVVRKLTDLPILRKDFVFDEFQVYESALIGADAILLIVAMLEDSELEQLYLTAENLGLDILVETHNLEELERAKKLDAKIIGVNNRNLHSFEVSLEVSRELIKNAPKDALMICESGLSTKNEIAELHKLGFAGFLIGETLMRSDNAAEELQKLIK